MSQRPLILLALTAIMTIAIPAPSDFPQPGTFCAPLVLCEGGKDEG